MGQVTQATDALYAALRHYMSDGVQCQIDREPHAQRAYSALFDAVQEYDIVLYLERNP